MSSMHAWDMLSLASRSARVMRVLPVLPLGIHDQAESFVEGRTGQFRLRLLLEGKAVLHFLRTF